MEISCEELLWEIIFLLNEKIKDFYMHSPMECYKTMNIQFAGFTQRVPQYYIASCLNISTVHLSCLEYAMKKNIQTVNICYCMKTSGLFICSSA